MSCATRRSWRRCGRGLAAHADYGPAWTSGRINLFRRQWPRADNGRTRHAPFSRAEAPHRINNAARTWGPIVELIHAPRDITRRATAIDALYAPLSVSPHMATARFFTSFGVTVGTRKGLNTGSCTEPSPLPANRLNQAAILMRSAVLAPTIKPVTTVVE